MVVDFLELDSLHDAVKGCREFLLSCDLEEMAFSCMNLISQVFDESTILSKCSCSASATEWIVLYRRQSSTKSLIVVCMDTLATM